MDSLSGGQQQRVAIARALVNRPKVLLLDEPLAALDLRLRKDMQNELKRIQQATGITFIYVTHDQEEALSMSDTVVVMDKGRIQQIGRPEDIYNEPKNAFVADFIGESNILDGVMLSDYHVRFFGRVFDCVDKGFAPNESVDVVIRPEDIDIVPQDQGHLVGTVTSITFKGLNYDIIVEFKGFKWLIQTTDYHPVGAVIGIRLNPEDIHIMHKSEYSGMFGDYSSYSAEYDELTEDAEMKKNNAVLLSAPYLIWMVVFTLIPLGVVAYYALTDPSTGAFSLGNLANLGMYLPVAVAVHRLLPDFCLHLPDPGLPRCLFHRTTAACGLRSSCICW